MKLVKLEFAVGPVAGQNIYINPDNVALVGPDGEGTIGVAVVQLSLPQFPAILVKGGPSEIAAELATAS